MPEFTMGLIKMVLFLFYKNTSKIYDFRIKAKKHFKTTLEK